MRSPCCTRVTSGLPHRAAEQRDERASPHGRPSSGLGPYISRRCAKHRCASQQKLHADVADGAKAAVSRCSQEQSYSITSSARASSAGGTSRPSAFAILRLMTSSYLVGACTGRQVGRLPPFRMRFCVAANHDAARRACPHTTIGRMSGNVGGPDGTEARIAKTAH